MSIQTLLGNSSTGIAGRGASSSQASGSVSGGASVFAKAENRIQADVNSTTARLSKFGLLKSAVAGAQTAARALAGLASSASATEVTTSVAKFFNAFNSAIVAVKNANAGPDSAVASQSANRVSHDLKRALVSDAEVANAAKRLGLRVQSDGTLTHDAKTFASALATDPSGVHAALVTVGKRVDSIASSELAADGLITEKIAALSRHGTDLAAQQKALKALSASVAGGSQSSSGAAMKPTAAQVGYGVSVYQKNSP